MNTLKSLLGKIGIWILIGIISIILLIPPRAERSADGRVKFTFGTTAYAAGTADFSLGTNGTANNATLNAALTALPSQGGLFHFKVGTYNVTGNVSRAIGNVTIEGEGQGTRFTRNASAVIFTAGGNNWVFRDLSIDSANTISMGTFSGEWYNVYDGTTNWTERIFRNGVTVYSLVNGVETVGTLNATQVTATTGNISTLNAPTGRGATYVIAFADATALEKAQADLKLTGTGDTAAVQAYLNTANNTHIHFTSGSMNVTAHPTMNQSGQIPGLYVANSTNLIITGEGQATKFLVTTNNTAWGLASCSNITLSSFMVVGNNNSAFSLQTGIAMFFGNDNIRIQNLDIQSTGYDAIYGLASCTNILVEGCRITYAGDDGINPGGGFGTEVGSNHWVITNNIISGVKNDGIHISISSWGILVNGNTISNCIDGVGIFNSSNNTISNNKILNVSNGILTLSGTCAYLNIDNNYIENVSVVGINLAHASTYSKVTNNKLINITDRAIFIQGGSTYVLVDGNQISTALRGVQFADVAGTVTNNHISGVSAYGVVYNIAAPTIGNALIANNNILGGGSANAIFLAGSNCSVVNNMLSGTWTGGAISPGAGTNNIIRGNWGYFTESSGNFTVSANTNTIAVTHGLALTPTDIQITFSGNTTGFVTAVGATTFNVTTTTNVTTNILGYWRAVVGAGN